ncbi:MAG: DUF420 domain-containing protein [Candidatus Margulisiibacteriota bacterium]
MNEKQPKTAYAIIFVISFAAFLFLLWLIYLKPPTTLALPGVQYLPLLNCVLNACSAIALVFGILAIKAGNTKSHPRWMLGAFGFSSLFLLSYVIYHAVHGDTHFLGTGLIRPIYFFVLISHIVLTVGALPMILTTFFLGLSGRFPLHKKLARYTFPLWLYVSVTGVLIYVINKGWG